MVLLARSHLPPTVSVSRPPGARPGPCWLLGPSGRPAAGGHGAAGTEPADVGIEGKRVFVFRNVKGVNPESGCPPTSSPLGRAITHIVAAGPRRGGHAGGAVRGAQRHPRPPGSLREGLQGGIHLLGHRRQRELELLLGTREGGVSEASPPPPRRARVPVPSASRAAVSLSPPPPRPGPPCHPAGDRRPPRGERGMPTPTTPRLRVEVVARYRGAVSTRRVACSDSPQRAVGDVR